MKETCQVAPGQNTFINTELLWHTTKTSKSSKNTPTEGTQRERDIYGGQQVALWDQVRQGKYSLLSWRLTQDYNLANSLKKCFSYKQYYIHTNFSGVDANAYFK